MTLNREEIQNEEFPPILCLKDKIGKHLFGYVNSKTEKNL
jgi:hypothetical protein